MVERDPVLVDVREQVVRSEHLDQIITNQHVQYEIRGNLLHKMQNSRRIKQTSRARYIRQLNMQYANCPPTHTAGSTLQGIRVNTLDCSTAAGLSRQSEEGTT